MNEPGRQCGTCGERYGSAVLFCPRDGTPVGPETKRVGQDPYLGRIIAGQFRVERLLGMGAMARVYHATQLGLERSVALKILHRELLRDEAAVARLRREAKVGGQLRHSNLAEVLMLGSIDPENGQASGEPFIVLEYLDGMSLRSALLAQGGSLGLTRSVHVALQICD